MPSPKMRGVVRLKGNGSAPLMEDKHRLSGHLDLNLLTV